MSPSAPLNVLVVEDREEDAETLRTVLRQDGHRVRVAADGEAALRAALDEPPDVMLLDLALPKLDGYQVAAAARNVVWRRRPLLVAVTGHGEDEYRRRAAAAGIDLFMVKPVDPDVLRSALRTYKSVVVNDPRRTARWAGEP
ncbi:MAG TPA: response regulator [Gemmataceae bacterium]|jgi:CheY-like chemotaxis protein